MSSERVRLEAGWKTQLGTEFDAPYMQHLRAFLVAERQAGKEVYPPSAQIFGALDATPFDQVRVVILGQDPYHGPGQAQGLCFSVLPGVPVPPSLMNIYAEIERDLGHPRPHHGDLRSWAQQGVLLLNAVLTVERGNPGSHQGHGWEQFTDTIVQRLNDAHSNLVFLLWGGYAQAKGKAIDGTRHKILKAPHPSPLSAYRGFIGCGHFSAANAHLVAHGRVPIDWRLPAVPDRA